MHDKCHAFGALSEAGRKLFRIKGEMNEKAFLEVFYVIKHKFKKLILVIDKASWHHKSEKVKNYLKKHKQDIKVVKFPTGCPEMNPVEECWRQAKREINGGRIHESFELMRKELRHFLRYSKFKQDMGKYLCP